MKTACLIFLKIWQLLILFKSRFLNHFRYIPKQIFPSLMKESYFDGILEKLCYRKITWEYFFDQIQPFDEGLRIATTKEGNTILHIAVLHNKKDLPPSLIADTALLYQKNLYGLIPMDLARFLNRESLLQPKTPHAQVSFDSQSRVFWESSMQLPMPRNFSFFSCPVFEDVQMLHRILYDTHKAKLKDLILPEKKWMGIYFDREIRQGIHPPVLIRFIDRKVGFGVFAMQKIPACSYVGEYTGIVRKRMRRNLHQKDYIVRYGAFQLDKQKLIIDAETGGNFTRWINHSPTPNLTLQSVYYRGMPRMIFTALQEIKEGVQLTFDYGSFFWRKHQRAPKSI